RVPRRLDLAGVGRVGRVRVERDARAPGARGDHALVAAARAGAARGLAARRSDRHSSAGFAGAAIPGGRFRKGSEAPSEDLAARRVPLGPERLGDLAEDGGVVDRRRRRVLLAVRDPFHRAAQDLARARLGQSLDDERGLERGDGADLGPYALDELADDLGLA